MRLSFVFCFRVIAALNMVIFLVLRGSMDSDQVSTGFLSHSHFTPISFSFYVHFIFILFSFIFVSCASNEANISHPLFFLNHSLSFYFVNKKLSTTDENLNFIFCLQFGILSRFVQTENIYLIPLQRKVETAYSHHQSLLTEASTKKHSKI